MEQEHTSGVGDINLALCHAIANTSLPYTTTTTTHARQGQRRLLVVEAQTGRV